MNRRFDALVLGGGLFGAFTALFLARLNRHVALVERGEVGAQASGVNFGGLRLQGRAPVQYPLSLLAQQHWESFETLTGEGCDYDRNGMVYLADNPADRQTLLKYAENSRACGLDIELWQGATLRAKLPGLTVQDDALASYSPRCAVANPRVATLAVVRAGWRAGGVLFERTGKVRIEHSDHGFTLSSATLAPVCAPILVNAAGAWGDEVAAQFGETVPLTRAGPPQFVTAPLPRTLRPSLYTITGNLIVRQTRRGNLIFAHKTLAGMARLAHHLPTWRHAEVIRVWSGVEGYLPDMLPVIGASRKTPGLWHAFGGSGGGFQIAPAVGQCLAQSICGQCSPVDITPYTIDRFTVPVAASEKMRTEFDTMPKSTPPTITL